MEQYLKQNLGGVIEKYVYKINQRLEQFSIGTCAIYFILKLTQMKKVLLSILLLISLTHSFAQSVTLSGTSYVGTQYCSATNANKTYGLMNTIYNGKNQYEYSFTGMYSISCSFIIRWDSSNWELVSKEQTGPSTFNFTTLSTVSGNVVNPPCGPAFGGTISGDCSQNCTASMSVSGAGTICFGASANLIATGCTGTVNWNNGSSTGSSITVSPSETTTYTATCSTVGVCTVSSQVNVEKPPAPQIMITGSGVVFDEGINSYVACSGTSIQLYCGNCSYPTFDINWSNGTTSTNSSSSAPFIPISSGTYYATQTTKATGCTGPVGNTVALMLKSKMIVQASNNNFCKGGSTTLTASGCPGTVSWDNGAGTGTSVTVTPPYNMTYTATCSDNQICSASIVINVTVPTPVGPSVSASSTVLCPNTSIILSGNGCTMGSFLWSNGSTTNFSITVNTPGSYSLVCSTNLSGCNSPQSNTITISSASADLTLSGDALNGERNAIQTINSTQNIPGNVNSGYYAGKSITLSPTFTTQSGAVFNAEIRAACN